MSEPPPHLASAADPATGPDPGPGVGEAEVIDRAVLAERRALRAEAAHEAQAHAAAVALEGLAGLERRLTALTAERDALVERARELERRVAQPAVRLLPEPAGRSSSGLEEDLAAARAARAETEERLVRQRAELAEAREALGRVRREAAELRLRLRSQASRAAADAVRVAVLESGRSTDAGGVGRLRDEVRALEARLAAERRERAIDAAAIRTAHARVAGLKGQRDELRAALAVERRARARAEAAARSRSHELEAARAEAGSLRARLEAAAAEAADAVRALRARADELGRELQEARRERAAARAQAEDAVRSGRAETAAATTAREAAERGREAAERRLSELVARLESELESQRTAREALAGELDRERQARRRTAAEAREQRAATARAREHARALEARLARVAQPAVPARDEELSGLREQTAALREQVATLSDRLARTRRALDAAQVAEGEPDGAGAAVGGRGDAADRDDGGQSANGRSEQLTGGRTAVARVDPRLEARVAEQLEAARSGLGNRRAPEDIAARLDAAAQALRAQAPAPVPAPPPARLPARAPAPVPAPRPVATSSGARSVLARTLTGALEPAATRLLAGRARPRQAPMRTGRLREALVALAHEDPLVAARMLASLLPAQGALVQGDVEYDLRIHELGCFAVSVAGGRARVQALERPRSRRQVDFHVSAGALTWAELLAGRRRRVGRLFAPVTLRGSRARLAELDSLAGAEAKLGELVRAGARLEPWLIMRALPHAVDPAWTAGHFFTVAQEITGDRPQTWYLTAAGPAGVSVSPGRPLRSPDARVSMSRATFDRLLAGDEPDPGAKPWVWGDYAAVERLRGWAERARA